MICVVCGTEVDSIKEAVYQGCIPYFYEKQIECGPACPNCSVTLLEIDENGDMELKRQFQGKINYKKDPFDEVAEEMVLIGIALENNSNNTLN